MMKRIRATMGGKSPAGSWRNWKWELPVALVALGLAIAGCGGGSNSSSSAPAASGGGGSDSTKLVQYAQCMRKNGVPNFPDPQNGAFVAGGDIDPNSPQFKSAMAACRKLLPGGVSAGGQ